MQVKSFLDLDTQTFTHVLIDTHTKQCAVIDPVLGFDPKSGNTNTLEADKVITFIQSYGYDVTYIIETHAHADHLSAAPYMKTNLGGQLVIGKHIEQVQHIFKSLFNLETGFKTDASQFDVLTQDNSELMLGELTITALHVPGHTPADMAYVVTHDDETVAFVGDTIFAPDVGTARCDFPGGSAKTLYQSIHKLLNLPEHTKLYLCHDYPPENVAGKARDYQAYSTVADEKKHNIHVKQAISEQQFIDMREARDKTLDMPRLILPSVQVNIRAGQLPPPENNGVRYLKIPLNAL